MYPLYSNIKNRRKELKISQGKLAVMIGYKDKSMISKIEKGNVDLPYSKIIAISEALRISEPELLGWKQSPSGTFHTAVDYNEKINSENQELKVSEPAQSGNPQKS